MRWEDERYVRLYTRNSADWLMLSFEAQGLLSLLLRVADRAGIIPLGRHGKRAVAVVVGHPARWETIEPALEELLADGCVEHHEDRLVLPNFIAAQEAVQSDRMRKSESRARSRDIARASGESVTKRDEESRNVTESHARSQTVTRGHAESRAVTPSLAVPCRAEPSLTVPSQTPPSPSPGEASADADPELQLVADFVRDVPDPGLGELAEAWNEITAPPLPRVTAMPPDRKKRAQAARKRRPMAEWREVFRRAQASAFCRGEDGGWKADFDWAIRPGGTKPEPAQRLLEGAFDRTGPPGASAAPRRGAPIRAQDVDWTQEAGESPF